MVSGVLCLVQSAEVVSGHCRCPVIFLGFDARQGLSGAGVTCARTFQAALSLQRREDRARMTTPCSNGLEFDVCLFNHKQAAVF
jgi:hypothetical protein